MRVLERPPRTMISRVIGANRVLPAETDRDGWYVVAPGVLYYVHECGYRVWLEDGKTKVIDPLRANIWANLLDIGASDEDAERLSR